MSTFRGLPGGTRALLAASFGVSLVCGVQDASAANKIYDMNPIIGQENPLDVQRVAQPPATPAAPPQAPQNQSRSQFGSQLYDMTGMLNERNPFDTAPIASDRRPVETAQAPAARDVAAAPVKPASSGDPGNLPDLDEEYDPGQIGADVDGRDPLEPVNRAIFGFNEFVYQYLLTPAARGYNKAVPEIVRDSLSHTIANVNAPVILANDVLQGEVKRAGNTIARFLINSTLGFFGTQDPASELGFPKHSEDFGQTMGAWGVGEGFYVVLPLLGPSNPRDAVGKLFVDSFFDPFGYYLSNTDNEEWGYVRSGVNGFDEYAGIVDDLDNLRQTSVDFYGALRSLYRQRREAEIRNQEQGAVPALGGR